MNVLGFFSVGICYAFGTATGLIDINASGFDTVAFQKWFFTGTILTWAICAIFSVAYFFTSGKMQRVFLWAPAVVPFFYGLSTILLT